MNKNTHCFRFLTADGELALPVLFGFEGLGNFSACEPNVNAPCELKLGVQLKEKEKVYAASQMEDGSIKESSLEDFKTLSDFLRGLLCFTPLNAKYDNILLTVSTKDGKKKTYAVKDVVRVMNDKELGFILEPGPDPNVALSNTAEEMEVFVWYSRNHGFNLSNLLAQYVHSNLEFWGLSVYNASEDRLDVLLRDLDYGTAGYADRINPAWYGGIWGLQYWLEKQINNDAPLVLSGRDRKGKEVRMLKKLRGYSVSAGILKLELSSKGLKAKSGDVEAIEALKEFKSGNYKNLVIRALHLLARGSLYSYSIPAFKGVMKKCMDGGFRLAFKDVDKKALQYDNRTGVVSSMDASDFIEFLARRKHEYIAHLLLKDSGKRFKFKLGELKGVKKADGGWTLLTDVLEVDGGCQVLDAFLEGEEWKEVRMGLVLLEWPALFIAPFRN